MIAWRKPWSRSLRSISIVHNSTRRQRQAVAARAASTYRVAELLRPHQTEKVLVVNGSVRSIRRQKRVAFARVSDGSSLDSIQVVLSPEQAQNLTNGSAVTIKGHWKESPGSEQPFELAAKDVTLHGETNSALYPIQKQYQTPEYLRTLPHLRTRIPFNAMLLRLRSQMIAEATKFFADRGFVQTHTPIITSSDCEGAGEVFTVSPNEASSQQGPEKSAAEPFFGAPKYLTVSSQLHLEALAQSVGNVWTLSPAFRAEKSDTARHLSEFYMLEAEMAFIQDIGAVTNLVEDLVKTLVSSVATSRVGEEILGHSKSEHAHVSAEAIENRWNRLTGDTWSRMTYHEAVQRLRAATDAGLASFGETVDDTSGLDTEHERYLVKQGTPVFVTDYPKAVKPFYMAPSTPSSNLGAVATVACFDLLLPDVCEVVGGSMREHRLGELEENMRSHGLLKTCSSTQQAGAPGAESDCNEIEQPDSSGLDWYLDLRRYGTVPHGGFGLGFDRLVAFVAGVSNIRDIVAFPRWHTRCSC